MARRTLRKMFAKGVKALISATLADDQALKACQGLFQRKRGRYTSCWEGRSIDQVNGVDLKFPALSRLTDGDVLENVSGNILFWYDFSDPNYYTESGGEYVTVIDKLGSESDLTVNVGNPKIKADSPNGLNCMGADSGTPQLTSSGGTTDLDGFSNGFFAAIAFKWDGEAGNLGPCNAKWDQGEFALASHGGASGNEGHTIYFTEPVSGAEDLTDVSATYPVSGSGVAWSIGLYVSDSSGNWKLYKDGTLAQSGTADPQAVPQNIWVNFRTAVTDDARVGEIIAGNGDSLTDDEISYIVQYLGDKWGVSVTTPSTIENGEIGRPPHRMAYIDAVNRVVASNINGVTSLNSIDAALYRGGDVVQAHEFGDYVFFCADKAPIYAVHNDNLTNAIEGSGGTGTPWVSIVAAFQGAGNGLFVSNEWHDTSSLDLTEDSTDADDSGSATKFEIGSGSNDAWHRGGNVTYSNGAGHIQFSRGKNDLLQRHLPKRGYFFDADTDTGVDLIEAAEGTQENAIYRAAVPAQWAMGRFPFTYDGRLSYIEGREYETSYLFGGTGQAVASVGADYVQIGADLSADDLEIPVGGRIILDDTLNPDPLMFNLDTMETFTITGVDYDAGTPYTRIYVDGAPSSGLENWWIQSPLTPRERRQIWHTGRPADSDRNISSREDQDPFYVHSGNKTPWGDDADGDCTAVIQAGDRRAYLSQESAIYYLNGTPPVDGVSPPGYGVRLVKKGVGIRNDAAWTFGRSRERIYFNSPVDNRMHVLQGSQIAPIDDDVIKDSNYSGIFSHVAFDRVNNRIMCLDTTSATPKIWFYDEQNQIWDGFTIRQSCGTNQDGDGTAVTPGIGSIGTWAAATSYAADDMVEDSNGNIQVVTSAGTSGGSEPTWATTNGTTTTDNGVTWTCYKAFSLYDTGTDGHGGLFQPFQDEDESSRILVIFRNSSGVFCARTLNHEDDYHTDARLRHGAKLTPSLSTLGGAPITGMEARHVRYERIVEDADAGSPTTYDRIRISAQESEGASTEEFYDSADWSDDQNETTSYKHFFAGGRGSPGFGLEIGDGIAPLGEIEVLDIDVRERGS